MVASNRSPVPPPLPLRFCCLACVVCFACVACFGGGGITPVRTPFNKGVYHYSAGNYDEAIAEYHLALDENPDDHRARFNLAMAYEAKALELGRDGKAELARKLAGDAEREYRTLLRLRPGALRASINLAAIEYARGEGERAKRRLAEAIRDHGDIGLPRTSLASYLLREGKAREAASVLEGALAVDPASLEANMLMGRARQALADVQGARSAYLKALERDDSDLATLLSLARLAVENREPEEALVWLQRMLFIDPDHFEAHLLLSEVFEKLGRGEEALRHLWRARDLDPGGEARGRKYRARLGALYQGLLEGLSTGKQQQ